MNLNISVSSFLVTKSHLTLIKLGNDYRTQNCQYDQNRKLQSEFEN